jgi:hypothetical protein
MGVQLDVSACTLSFGNQLFPWIQTIRRLTIMYGSLRYLPKKALSRNGMLPHYM